ncbi:mRNA interferase MazF [Micromonospora palomenae]|uniref:mRNA interferase MazF n=1 Tax=Micromonospora palomenae TaxID=1461247 RepID=A0A561WW71_9ACTN|nr:type II toxin-antitoxin system PemK/MazF family toxin [Micromonospora palomenae]TWG28115.1 mRNA interferase MazF [Micromonospora palomenae]
MERGELWWAQLDDERPVVLLSDGAGPEFRAVQIVAPATPVEKQGLLLMSGEQAVDADERRRVVEAAGPDVRAIGIEVFFGAQEGLAEDGVVRVALPIDGKTFCTWMLSLSGEYLIERIGVLSPAKLRELDVAMELSDAE